MEDCTNTLGRNKLNITLSLTLVVFGFIGILMLPKACSQGVRLGLTFCSEVLIPSLFPFMVLATFVVKSGISRILEKILGPITKVLFNLPGSCGATILVSMIGGYPTGIRGIRALLDDGHISASEAERLCCFAVGAGPAFVISVVGGELLGSSKLGLILLIAQILAAILIGIILGVTSRLREPNTKSTPSITFPQKKIDPQTALVISCIDATQGMLHMCAFVVLFSAIISMLNSSHLSHLIIQTLSHVGINGSISASLIPVMLEVTSGCIKASSSHFPVELISFALGWAGVCVHFQFTSTFSDTPLSKIKFPLCKFMHGITSAIIARISLTFINDDIHAFIVKVSSFHPNPRVFTTGSLALILLCACFLSTLTPEIVEFREAKKKSGPKAH